MYYKVFLDTNAFESCGFNFDNGFFNQLRLYAERGVLNLQINKVVDGEVRDHIKRKIPEAVDGIRKEIYVDSVKVNDTACFIICAQEFDID